MDSKVHPSAIKLNRKSQLFVEIPRSPFLSTRDASTTNKVDLSASHPYSIHKQSILPLSEKTTITNIPGQKRKASHDHGDAPPEAKKLKSSKQELEQIICHQCRSKRLSQAILQCTCLSQKSGIRCKASYCTTCLRNRYGEDIEKLRQTKSIDAHQVGNEKGIDYTFNCPRCEGYCNCAPCRKKQGLPAVGKLAVGQTSVREILEKNPQATVYQTKTPINADNSFEGASNIKLIKHPEKDNAGQKMTNQIAKPEPVKKHRKDIPEPVWVPVPVTGMSLKDIEDRIFLREFILRFKPILNIGIRNVDDLEDFNCLHDASAKAVLLSLLDLIAIETAHDKKIIQTAVKTIRALGLNWGKIIPVLYDLRDIMPQNHPIHNLPVLQITQVEPSYKTRGTTGLQSIHADQILPILLFLIDILLEGESVRLELEEGVKQAKEARAAFSKALKEETENWASQKASLLQEKPTGEKKARYKPDPWRLKYQQAEAEHKRIVADLQNFHKTEADSCLCRFMPLGCDMDGRTYYILSSSGPQKGKRDRLPSEPERMGMKRWGWFVAVFGKPGTTTKPLDVDNMETDSEANNTDDPNAPRWWGFASTDEMRKLSRWLTYRAELEFSGPETSTRTSRPLTPLSDQDDEIIGVGSAYELKSLAKSIITFADFIEWRLKKGATVSKN